MRILIVEDDKKIASFIKKGLTEEQYAVDVCYDGEEGLYWAEQSDYDVIILDIMLPKKNGMKVCKELRENGINSPIIMLTAKDAIKDKIKGLDEGADDYLTKPFAFEELLARIKALLRRNQQYKTEILKVADLEFDTLNHKVRRAGKEIILSGKEYALLEYLMRNKGKSVKETMIIEHVWDRNFDSFSNVVNVYIHHLREKIDRGFSKKLIHTIRGVGYFIKDDEGSV